MEIQSVLFPISKFSLAEAREWIIKHGFKKQFYRKKPETLGNYHRFRQLKPIEGAQYYVKKKDRGIMFVFMK